MYTSSLLLHIPFTVFVFTARSNNSLLDRDSKLMKTDILTFSALSRAVKIKVLLRAHWPNKKILSADADISVLVIYISPKLFFKTHRWRGSQHSQVIHFVCPVKVFAI